jgi:hypothetical protein
MASELPGSQQSGGAEDASRKVGIGHSTKLGAEAEDMAVAGAGHVPVGGAAELTSP